jgi:hypothetical protein
MPEMGARWRFGLMLTLVASGCVPTPASRATPTGDATGGSPRPDGGAVSSPSQSLSATAGPSSPPSFVRPTPFPSPTFLVYEVRAGDSLTSIARLFGTTARSIAFWNRDRYPSLDPDSAVYDPNRIAIGWTLLVIPTEVVNEEDLPDRTAAPSSPTGSSPIAPISSPS